MTRCPLCRARLAGADTCPRCGADLALAQAARSAATGHLERALTCLAAGEHHRAATHTDHALRLHRTELAETIAGWLRAPAPDYAVAFDVQSMGGLYDTTH